MEIIVAYQEGNFLSNFKYDKHFEPKAAPFGTDTNFLFMLALKTALPRRRVLAMTMRGYKGYRREDLMAKPQSPWLLYKSSHAFTRRKPWLSYCPYCLQSDSDPYFRRYWRLAFVTVCPEHHRRLLDRCHHCDSVINFHMLPGDAEAITVCQTCRYDIRLTPALMIGESADNQRHLLEIQTFLLKTLRSGRCRLSGLPPIRGAVFFERLRKLMLRFLTIMHTPLFREVFGGSLHVSFFDSHLASVRHRALEGLSVEDRFLFMLFLSWWFNEQPERLVALCAPNSD